MPLSDYEIAVATPADVPGIFELQQKNLISNGGALIHSWSPDWFETCLKETPIIVVRRGGKVVAYLVSSTPQAQMDLNAIVATVKAYPGGPGAYLYGPVCVAESERGQGLPAAMFAALRAQLPGREAITFIRAANTASRKAHAKLGMREVAETKAGDIDLIVLSHPG
jgi:predicted GNAT superfamily acetyltransferase